ncbi:uncharacterized protein LOC105698058 [Orussus abietinus]|uniref:uncharacterized protein LOC105698058 n=1 Tax=Orussus abietinus TaxID=222816 RepID=UPI000624FFBB|nr:uncharacterized protein LOC105698058 [Orussus abietinus]
MVLRKVLLLGIVLLGFGKIQASTEQCSILVNGGLPDPQPLILKQGHEKGFVYPNEVETKNIVLSKGESFRLACPGSKLEIQSPEFVDDAIATCVGGTSFSIGRQSVVENFRDIRCSSYPKVVALGTSKTCPNGKEGEIGFSLSTGEFYRVIDICHNATLAHTTFAHAKIPAVIDAAQTGFPRISFRKGPFYRGLSMDSAYSRGNQRSTLARILKSEALAEKYIPRTGETFLTRGHLVAKGDFIYGTQQRATFFYANTVPTWNTVNSGNWMIMEADVKTYAIRNKVDLDVYVGSHGILTLPNATGQKQELHLHVTDRITGVPIPRTLFKVVYDSARKRGVVFLTANNPFLQSVPREYVICKDVCDEIKYISWKATKLESGFSYCCEIDDFRHAFPGLPGFETVGLLV